MAVSDRRKYWRHLISEQASSGESIAGFCRRRKLSEASFYYWRKRLRDAEPAPRSSADVPASEVPSVAVSVVGGGELVVQFPGRVTMCVPRDHDLVRCMVDALRDRRSDA